MPTANFVFHFLPGEHINLPMFPVGYPLAVISGRPEARFMPFTFRPARVSRSQRRTAAPQLVLCGCLLLTAIARAPAQEAAPPVQLPADSGITCILKDANGNPVSDLAVEIRSSTPPLERALAVSLPDGSVIFRGLPAGMYDVTVAGGIPLPPKRAQIDASNPTLALQLPFTLPQVAGHGSNTVSVGQLTISEKAREALRKAYEAWDRKDTKQSRMWAIRALQVHPYYGPALSLLGILELDEGHPADAIIGLQQALQYNPNSPRTYLALASAYNELHNNTDALYALSIMAKLLPDSWQLHYEVGRAYLGQARFNAALEEFNRAQQSAQGESLVVHVGKAHALLGLHNYVAARTEFENVLRKSPNGPYAAECRQLAVLLDSQLKKPAPKPDASAHGSPPPRMEQ